MLKAAAGTKARQVVEALYFIMASRSDRLIEVSSLLWQLMKESAVGNWRQIASRLTMEQVMEERFADTYHALWSETIHL